MWENRNKYTMILVFKDTMFCYSKKLRLNRKLKFRSKTHFSVNTQSTEEHLLNHIMKARGTYFSLQESSDKRNKIFFIAVFFFFSWLFFQVFIQNVHL